MLSLSITSPSSSAISFLPKPLQFRTSFNGIQLLQPNTCTIPATKRAALVPVMMSKREDQLEEIRAKTTEQINEQVMDLKGELLMLQFAKDNRQEYKSSDFRKLRKWIARLLTVKREREIEEGIGKRLSRKLDKRWKRSVVVRPPISVVKYYEREAAKKAAEAE